MASMKDISIAVIGTGVIGPRHARSVLGCRDAILLCLVDPGPKARDIAADLDVPLYSSVSEMLRSDKLPDAAIVCTPNSTHVAIGKQLLEAGVNVLVEKPISTTIASGQELVETARRSGKHLLVGHHRRFNPYVTATKRALTENVVGKVIAISGLWVTCKPAEYFHAPNEWLAKAGDGGPILINLIHDVDILQYLLGPIIRVHAEGVTRQRGHEAEEGAAILLRFASGVVGTFLLSDAIPSPHNFESATGENPLFPKAGRDIYRILGTEGTLSMGDMLVSRYGKGSEKSWTSKLMHETLPVGQEIPFDEQVNHLVRVVRGEERPRCTGDDGLNAATVCDAIKRAVASDGRATDVPHSKL